MASVLDKRLAASVHSKAALCSGIVISSSTNPLSTPAFPTPFGEFDIPDLGDRRARAVDRSLRVLRVSFTVCISDRTSVSWPLSRTSDSRPLSIVRPFVFRDCDIVFNQTPIDSSLPYSVWGIRYP